MIVHQTTRTEATQPMAQWLSRVLDPVAQAVRLTTPPPIEIRSTGKWSGWCSDSTYSPDKRVTISQKIVFWEEEDIVYLYLHEVAHRLLEHHDVKAHSVEFLTVNTVLLLRAEKFFRADPILKLKVYDFADAPEELAGHPEANTTAMAWALAEAPKLAESDLTAEELASEVVARWKKHVKRLEAAEKAAQRAEQQRQNREARMQNTIDNLRFWVVGLPILTGMTVWLVR